MTMRGELTANEMLIVETIASGRSDKETAYHLSKAYQTLKNTKNKIFDKLDIPHNTAALVAWYYCKTNNIDLPDFMRKTTASILLLGLFLSATTSLNETYARRVRRGRRDETEVVVMVTIAA